MRMMICEKAKEISDAVKQFDKLAFLKMADFLHIKDGLNKINDSVTHTMMRLNEIEKSVKQDSRNQTQEQSMEAPESVGMYAEEMKKFMESKVAEGVSYVTNGEAYEAFKEYYDEKVKGEAQFEAEIDKAVASQMQEQRSGR